MIPTTRITDAKAIGVKSVIVEYSSICAFNQDNTRLLLLQSDGWYRLYDGDGNFIKLLTGGPISGKEPRWSRTDPNVLYYVSGNKLMLYDVALSASTTVHTFTEYQGIKGRGESDISEDGDHFAFIGDDREVFVYQISQKKKYPAFPMPVSLNGLYITPDNNVVCTSPVGVYLYSKYGLQQRKLAQTQSHVDVMRDANGDEVLIRINAADNPHLEGCANGIEKVRLADEKPECLWAIGWGLSVHISCPDRGFVLVSTFTLSGTRPSQIVKVPLDGSEREVLADTGTLQKQPYASDAARYSAQPKASISRDGSRFVYCSDKDGAVDVWMGIIAQPAPTVPAPTQPQPTQPVPTEPPPVQPLPPTDPNQWKELDASRIAIVIQVVNGQIVFKVYDKLP